MPTLSEMIDEVKSNLQGYTLRQDRITYVANSAGLTTTSTQIQVGSQSNLAKGIIEIDDELIWIDSFDKASNTLKVIKALLPHHTANMPQLPLLQPSQR
jgi:hypothetical protein